jgi:hypothetical protein
MVRKLLPLLLLAPLAARAHSDWDERDWAGDDEYSWQYDAPPAADPSYGYGQYDYQQEGYGSPAYGSSDEYAGAGPSIDDFRSGLDPYGRWIDTPEYGWVWQPIDVSARWQPYWDGRWVWTTAGWTWVTDEPWGWATYHYGRWALLAGAGWVWLPGRVWGPAWVAWRWGGGYAGWCPLGPRGVVYVEPRTWVFVETPYFMTPVRHHTVPISVVRNVWPRVQPMPIVHPSPRAGPPPRVVEQHTRVPVRAIPIVEAGPRTPVGSSSPGVVTVWRPRSVPYTRRALPPQPARNDPSAQGAVRGGWRERLPVAPRPANPGARSGVPAAQPARPVGQPAQPARPIILQPATPMRVPDQRAAPAPRADRETSARPHAQPMNAAREPERR